MKQRPNGFTLTELIVTIAILAVLGAMLLPVIGRVRLAVDQTVCTNNMRTVSLGMMTYLADNNNTFPLVYNPSGGGWQFTLVRSGHLDSPNIKGERPQGEWRPEWFKVMGCPRQRQLVPSLAEGYRPTFMMNNKLAPTVSTARNLLQFPNPAKTLLFMQGSGPTASGNYHTVAYEGQDSSRPSPVFGNKVVLSFCDGRVESRTLAEIPVNNLPGNSENWFFWEGRAW